jgi:hypothetical protein
VAELVRITAEAVPWAIPLVLASLALALVVVLVGRRRWGSSAWLLAALMVSATLIVAITLTPNAGDGEDSFADPRADPGPWGYLREPAYWGHVDERSLNVALFLPLGLVVGALLRGGWRWVGLCAGVALPWVIEGLQGVLPFTRDPDLADVADNSTGFLVGFATGLLVATALAATPERIRRASGP